MGIPRGDGGSFLHPSITRNRTNALAILSVMELEGSHIGQISMYVVLLILLHPLNLPMSTRTSHKQEKLVRIGLQRPGCGNLSSLFTPTSFEEFEPSAFGTELHYIHLGITP